MSILNVNTIQPVGSAQTVTVSATDFKIGTTTLSSGGSGTFVGNVTGNVAGNVTGNLNSSGVSTITTLQGSSNTITIPSGQTVLVSGTLTATALDIPYANLTRTNGYTVPDGFSSITWENVVVSKYITATASSANIQFQYAGKYSISVGWRFGVGGDVWTGCRLLDGATVRGIGYGTGQATNDPGPCQISFVANIPSDRINTDMTIQFYRQGSTMGIATPGGSNWAINCIIQYLGV
jgi:hypothetical protein